MIIKGFKNVSYQEFQTKMEKRFTETNISFVNMAVIVDVKSVQTVRNIFNKENQIVSDEVLTKALTSLDINGFLLWMKGERMYYLPVN